MPGAWHNKMENLFPETMREVKFYTTAGISNRRADILLSNNRTCEIQHSYISQDEIINRFSDWNIFGKTIIWLVDGNEGVQIDKLSTGNYLVLFEQTWKYQSFIKTYDFILLENDGNIFKIELKKIKSGMIELKQPKSIKQVIECLKNTPDKIWDCWNDENVIKSIIGVYQQGAGNGKTYNIWKSILENVDKNIFLILTKQHTARTVIYHELKDQMYRHKNGEKLCHIENFIKEHEENKEKHYVIKYTNKKSNRECIVVIGTIDSFCYNLSQSNSKGANFFKDLVDNIISNGSKKLKNGYMNFGGQYIQLSKKSEIWIDEVQDLPENYLYAMCKLIYETSCYINVVGDKLQSLEYSKNFLTSVIDEGLPNITIDIKEPINKNRRIKVTNMAEQINKLVKFDKYDLPIIECDDEIEKLNNEDPIKIIDTPLIYANDNNDKKIENYCDIIMQYYKSEVEINKYLPKDFLIIFPIMKSNVVAPELAMKIQEYWTEYYNRDTYIQYVYLHKHEEGTIINTDDSADATRIMSIRGSKGDGRKIVFILGITEDSLKIVSAKEQNIIYESNFHTALTRAKNQIYFGLCKNNDNIHKRFGDSGYVEFFPKINKNISINKVYNSINKNKIIELMTKNNICFENIIRDEQIIENKQIVDWGYHCIKYQSFYHNIILNIINSNKLYNDELYNILKDLAEYELVPLEVDNFYKYLKKHKYTKKENWDYFPVCKLSNKKDAFKYFKTINNTIHKIQNAIKSNTLNELTVYQSIILTYMLKLEREKRYCDISQMDIYNITHFFLDNADKEKELLNNIANVQNIIKTSGIDTHNFIEWNILKFIELDSKNEYFKVYKSGYPIIGNNSTDIVHIVLKSNISHLNFWDVMIEILIERFLIYNPKSDTDKNKFGEKKINTYLFLLDKNSFIKFEWDWDNILVNKIKQELKIALNDHFEKDHKDIYYYFRHVKNNNNELWKLSPDKIIDDIIQKCRKDMGNCPEYIFDFFKDINTKIEEEENYDYVNDKETFIRKLNKKLQSHLNKYFI